MNSNDLLVLIRGEPFPAKIDENLQRKGYSVRSTHNGIAAGEILTELANPILIIECGSQSGCHQFINELIGIRELLRFPVLVLGKDVDGLEARLNKTFPLATVLRAPSSPNEVLEAIRFIGKHYRSLALDQVVLPTLEETPEPEPAPAAARAPATAPFDEGNFEDAATVLSALTDEFANFKLSISKLNGDIFPLFSRPSYAGAEPRLFLESGPALEAVSNLESSLKPGSFRLLRRVAYAAAQLVVPLNMTREQRQDVIAASFLFASGFKRRERTFLSQDYTGRGTIVLRKEIASAIKDSALTLSIDLQLPRVAEIVGKLGRLIGQEEKVQDDSVSRSASVLLAADLLNRFCFGHGVWNPSAAYRLVKRIRAGKMRDLHPAVTCCLLKFVAEALTGEAGLAWLGSHDSQNSRPPQDLNPAEQSIKLADLTPGMRLSRPLFTQDGRKILAEDLKLDQDLIMRLWQLSALRAVAPAVVKDIQ